MNTNQEIQKDDEISLFELFTVLLHYRKLIAVDNNYAKQHDQTP